MSLLRVDTGEKETREKKIGHECRVKSFANVSAFIIFEDKHAAGARCPGFDYFINNC